MPPNVKSKMLPFGLFFEDITSFINEGANKATMSHIPAGFLPEEDVTRVILIASNDIPAEVINRTQPDWIFHRVLLLIYKVECCHCLVRWYKYPCLILWVNALWSAAFQQALWLFLYSAFNGASVLFFLSQNINLKISGWSSCWHWCICATFI